jgi:hypothetical protein
VNTSHDSRAGTIGIIGAGTVRAGYLGRDRIRASITRADIATFLLDQSTDPRFHRSAPAISN